MGAFFFDVRGNDFWAVRYTAANFACGCKVFGGFLMRILQGWGSRKWTFLQKTSIKGIDFFGQVC